MSDILAVSSERERMRVPSVPPPDEVWGEAIEALQAPVETELGITQNQKLEIRLIEVQWHFALHWVFREKWKKSHVIPYWRRLDKNTREAIGAFSSHLLSILNVCIQAHAIPNGNGRHYVNASDWWYNILTEIRNAEIEGVFEKSTKKGKKQVSIDNDRKLLQAVRQMENPYPEELFPHTYRFIESAFYLSKNAKDFKPIWKIFMQNWAAWLREQEINPNCQVITEQNGLLKISSGAGRGTVPLPGLSISTSETIVQREFQAVFRENPLRG